MCVLHRKGLPAKPQLRAWLAVPLALVLGGCLPLPLPMAEKQSNGDKPAGASTKKDVELDQPIAIDEGRLEVSPPKGWYVAERESTKIRVTPSEKVGYPSIIVIAEPFIAEMDVTSETAAAFAAKIELEQRLQSGFTDLKVKPVDIKGFRGAEYQLKGQAGSSAKRLEVDKLILVTAVQGRRYVLELHTIERTLHKYRPELYAVAAGLKFLAKPLEPPSGSQTGKK